MLRLADSEVEFWKQVYLKSRSAGAPWVECRTYADRAIKQLRTRHTPPGGVPENSAD